MERFLNSFVLIYALYNVQEESSWSLLYKKNLHTYFVHFPLHHNRFLSYPLHSTFHIVLCTYYIMRFTKKSSHKITTYSGFVSQIAEYLLFFDAISILENMTNLLRRHHKSIQGMHLPYSTCIPCKNSRLNSVTLQTQREP